MKRPMHLAPQEYFHFTNADYREVKLVAQMLIGDVGVHLRRGDVGVAEEGLDGAQVGSVFEEVALVNWWPKNPQSPQNVGNM